MLPGCGGGGSSSPAPAPPPANDITPEPGPTPLPDPDPTPLPVAHTLSGTITAANNAIADSDVNDPLALYTSNNDPNGAQLVTNPGTIGGFACARPTGIPGDRFEKSSDIFDRYEITMAEGQTVTLTVSDFLDTAKGTNDLDLYLYNVSTTPPTLAASSLGQNPVEHLTVPAGGTYQILVYAFKGRSNYLLAITIGTTANLGPVFRLEEDFVPDQLVVSYSEAPMPNKSLARLGLSSLRGNSSGPHLLQLKQTGTARNNLPGLIEPNLIEKYRTIRAVIDLRNQPEIKTADLNYRRLAQTTPDDPYYDHQWHIPLINLPQAWEFTTGITTDVVVAVVDTGIVMNHPDLVGAILSTGYDFIEDPLFSLDGDGIDDDPSDPGDHGDSGLSSFHGTHVAGIIGAATDNGKGVAGTAFNRAKIMPIRVLGLYGGTTYDILQGVRYAARLSNDSGTIPPRPAEIINLSLGGPGYSTIEEQTFQEVSDLGIILVAAAGNDADTTPYYPAAYPGVLGVSAVDAGSQLSYFSNHGSYIDLAAPGGDLAQDRDHDGFGDGILSTSAHDSIISPIPDYLFLQGTSMASPQVAGVAALMKLIHPELTPLELDTALAAGQLTTDLGPAGWDEKYGYGMIDALRAVQTANTLAGGQPLPPTLILTPNTLNFGLTTNTLECTAAASDSNGTPLTIATVVTDSTWLTVNGTTLDQNNLGTYQVVVDRTGLVDGIYSGTITFTTATDKQSTLVVTMLVSTGIGIFPDTGTLHLILTDETTKTVARTQIITPNEGIYPFSFSDLPDGFYSLKAGSDYDNDGVFCDPGESCGAYLTLDNPLTISLDSDRIDLHFFNSFQAAPFEATIMHQADLLNATPLDQ